ncbi:DUF4013 domain-containing protein [Puniceicoccaceae bacterium K14]|nr:DUF4013 domain-containing protein [Puniceicoccaceae bacterium K14]
MQTIEQVSKKLFSDSNWGKKVIIGGFITLIPIVNILAMGYLYRLFADAKRGAAFRLPEWGDWKNLFIDGLKFFLIGVVFVGLPLALVALATLIVPSDSFLARLPFIPVIFLIGPLSSAALYLYLVREDFKDCFNFDALAIMLKNGLINYAAPTLAFVGLVWLAWVILPFVFFFGGVIYFYVMASVFKGLESQ